MCEYILRRAKEPTIKKTEEGYEYRSREHWIELSRVKEGYLLTFGDNRGKITETVFSDRKNAEIAFEAIMKSHDMIEEKPDNNIRFKDLVYLYFDVGQYLEPDMDTYLDNFSNETKVNYYYENLFSSGSGFWAKVTLYSKNNRAIIFVDGDELGHLVRHIEIE